jgi:hypothetical protein
MQLVQSGNLDYDMARSLLDAYAWDVNACMDHLKSTLEIKLNLKNAGAPGNSAHEI